MSSAEITAIESLTQDNTLTIKPGDKGGALVIMGTLLYIQETERQLNDRSVYEVVTVDPNFRLGRIM